MVTASGKRSLVRAGALLPALLTVGCVQLATLEKPVPQAKAEAPQPQVTTKPLAGNDAPLPRQEYDGAGAKVRYVPQANPYTTQASEVPAEARIAFTAANAKLERGDIEGARQQFESLTKKFPKLSGPWVKLGEIAERNDSPDQAVRHYEKAIEVNPNNVNAYVALGLAQRRQGRFSDAQAAYLRALDVWRDFPEAHLNLAILYDLYVNQPEDAQKHYEAYYFLTGRQSEEVSKWLVEVRRRTGIERSFIDVPPKEVAEMPADKPQDADPSDVGGSPG